MVKALIFPDEGLRLKNLYEYEILDTPEEEDFNEIVRLASAVCNVPISLITLVDANRQWFKARYGLLPTWTCRDSSFCTHAMLNDGIFLVPDATKDERFFDNPLVTGDPYIRFYAGVPLVSPQGSRLGSLCVVDRKPGHLEPQQQANLLALGRQVVKLMELRRKNFELQEISFRERKQREELEKISERQKKMISILAHDIRAPLSSLKSLLQLIPGKSDSLGESGRFLEMANNQLTGTLSLLDNLVEWGQIQLSGITPDSEFLLNDIVRSLLEDLTVQAEWKGLALKSVVDPAIRMTADENKVRFILRNLLANAIKFTKSGSVVVDAVLTRKTVLVSVEDTGIGMPAIILEQLFESGRKSSRKGTRNEAGSGLGLMLVKEFIELMHGHVVAESTEGQGSLIAFDLPRFP
jgi:signal transduction histidine kinase